MDIRIQQIKIIRKSDVPHFYQVMLLTFSFNENLSSLVRVSSRLDKTKAKVKVVTFALEAPRAAA